MPKKYVTLSGLTSKTSSLFYKYFTTSWLFKNKNIQTFPPYNIQNPKS